LGGLTLFFFSFVCLFSLWLFVAAAFQPSSQDGQAAPGSQVRQPRASGVQSFFHHIDCGWILTAQSTS
jgi:hypothetical protein